MMTAFFCLVYYPVCELQISLHAMFWSIFAFIYAIWGLNHMFSVTMEAPQANMMSIVATFMCNFLVGVEPAFKDIVRIGPNFDGKIGSVLVGLSPMRWTLNKWVYDELI